MSVLIKGMKMPTYCLDCLFLKMSSGHGDYCVLTKRNMFRFKNRPDDCPLIEIPPHGNLIDADEFLKRAIGTKCFRGDYALMLEELVGESITIIPAELPVLHGSFAATSEQEALKRIAPAGEGE